MVKIDDMTKDQILKKIRELRLQIKEFRSLERERQLAEKALKGSKEKYRNLFENAEVGMYRTKLDGSEVMAVNQKITEIVGMSKEEILSNPAFIHWENPADREEMVQQLTQKGSIFDYEIRLVDKKGEVKTCLASGKILKEEGIFEGSLVDITRRKVMEEELRKREQEFKALVENAPDVITRFDKKLRHVYINSAVEKETGMPPEFFIGKTNRDLGTPKNILAKWEGAIRSVFKTGKETAIELDYPSENGVKCYFTRLVPEFNEAGSVKSVLSITRDLTERKRVETARREAEELLGTTLKSIGDSVISTDEKGIITFMNHTAEELTGWSAEKAVGKPLEKVFNIRNEDTGKKVESPVSRVLREGKVVGLANHTLLVKKDGTKIPIADSGAPIWDECNKIKGTVLVFQDITERRESEKALQENEEKFRMIAETSIDSIYQLDLNGNIIFMNDAGAKMYGYKPDEITEMNFSSLMTKERLTEGVEYVKQVMSGQSVQGEMYVKHKKGNEFPIYFSMVPVKKEGKIVGFSGISKDITERKRAEEALRESEEKWRSLTEYSSDNILTVDLNQNILFINHTVPGITIEETVGKSLYSFIPEKFHESVKECFKNVLKSGQPNKYYFDYLGPDGTNYYFEARVASMLKAGNITGFTISATDITERKRADGELKVSEEKYRNLFENAEVGMYRTKLDGSTVLAVNQKLAEIVGMSKEEILSNPAFIQWENPADRDKMVRQLIQIGSITDYEIRLVDKNDRIKSCLVSGKVFREEGTFEGSLVDITERKLAEEKTLHQQKIMNAINAIFKKALVCEREEDLAQTCLEVAQGLVGAKFGFFGEINSEGKFNTLAISNPGWNACKMPESEATRIIKGMEIRGMQFLPCKDGKPRIFNDPSNHPDSVGTPEGHPEITCLLAVPLKYGGKMIGQIGLGNKEGGYDLNDQEAIEALSVAMVEVLMRKRAEEERGHLTTVVEQKNKELEQIVYITSHDLRSPLVNIQGFGRELGIAFKDVLSTLQSEDVPKDVEKKISTIIERDILESMQYITTSIDKMDSLLTGVLKISRLGRVELKKGQLNMNKMISNIEKSYKIQIDEANALLETSEIPGCFGDETQINQVFTNLVDNSLKYFDPNRPGIIRVSGYEEGGKSIYCVEDNGIGITPENKDNVFDMFHQLGPGTGSGEGLGLTIVRRIVEKHDGKVWVESEPGKGSKFYVSLPCK